jgi:hypothetical protein
MTALHESLSPEARSLIERTYEWLQPKDRWIKRAYAVIRGRDDWVLEMEDEYSLIDKRWQSWEEEVYEGDEYDYPDLLTPYEKVKEPDQACLIGALITNNNYEKDHVYEEAVVWLNSLVDESKIKSDDGLAPAYYDDNPEVRLITFNDKSHDRRRVMNLLRRGFSRN